jgi:hypothetical protein
MSTKTIYKRIALVAVAALGFGMLSVAPSSAAIGTATSISVANTTLDDTVALAVGSYTSNAVIDALQISAFSVEAGSVVVLHLTATGGSGFTAENFTRVKLRDFGIVVADHANAVTATGLEDPLPGFTAPSVAGTYTLDVETTTLQAGGGAGVAPGTYTANTTLNTSVTMKVTAPSGYSNSLSTALIIAGNAATQPSVATDALAITGQASARIVNTAVVAVNLKDTDAEDMASGNTLSATISGPGYLQWVTAHTAPNGGTCIDGPTYTGTVGRSVTAQTADALGYLYICADGAAGVATVSISITNAKVTTVLSTKTVTFYGKVTTLTVSSTIFTIGKSGGATTGPSTQANLSDRSDVNIPALVVKMTDSAGRVANSTAEPTILSSDATVVVSGLCGLDDGLDKIYSSGGTGFYNCSFTTASSAVSGAKATITVRIVSPADATLFLTTTYVVTVGGSIATETLSLDKTSYAPGEAMVITRTAKDSAGNPVADATASPSVTFNKAVGGSSQSISAGTYVGGVSATSATAPSVFAPVSNGAFLASMTSGNTAKSLVTATATIAGDTTATDISQAAADAAAESTDAANAATDAANAAAEAADAATAAAQDAADAVAALSTQVAGLIGDLRKQITSLTNLVIKIQKKVKA